MSPTHNNGSGGGVSCITPAKTMLFGEYGALLGHPTWVATGLGHHFAVDVRWDPEPGTTSGPGVLVESPFFPKGYIDIPLPLPKDPDPAAAFFCQLLSPWEKALNKGRLQVTVGNHFPTHYGFGSSSALTVCLHRSLWKLFHPKTPMALDDLRALWVATGAPGSGYDVAAQFCGALSQETALPEEKRALDRELWEFRGGSSRVCVRSQGVPPSHMGFLLDTQLYAPTAALLKALSPNEKRLFGERHGTLATSVLRDLAQGSLTRTLLGDYMGAALAIAREQGIVPAEWEPLLATLKRHRIPVKTTGSGHGDALWVLGDPREVLDLLGMPPGRCLFEIKFREHLVKKDGSGTTT